MSGPQEQFLILTEAKATSPQFLYALSNAVSVLRGDMLATPGKMQRLTVVCGCMLLVIAASTSLVEANGGGKVPYYPRECVGKGPDECCKEKSNIDFQAFCSNQLVTFPEGCGVSLDSPEAALVMSSLVASISSAAINGTTNQAEAECLVRNSWSQIGADFLSIKFYFFDDIVLDNITFKGGAAIITAGHNVYIVFSGIQNTPAKFPNYPIKYSVGGVTGKTNNLWLTYYNKAFKQPGNDLIADAIACLHPGQKLYIAGWSVGGIAAIYASLDLLQAGVTADHIYLFGNQKPGDKAFVDSYTATPVGQCTSDWWNKKDINPVLPPKNNGQKIVMNNSGPNKPADGWTPVYYYKQLPGALYWRIVPDDITVSGYTAGQCVKVKDDYDPLYAACPNTPGSFTCGLNQEDHSIFKYQNNIKKCVLPTPSTIIHRPHGFNPICYNYVVIN